MGKRRDLSVLTDDVKERIERWLIRKDEFICPFLNEEEIEANCGTCQSLFPSLSYEGDPPDLVCPCNAFKISYVVRIAKELIK
jgi:hypothetical protein